MRTSLFSQLERLSRKLGFDCDQANWKRLWRQDSVAWQRARSRAAHGPAVLIATSHAGHTPSTTLESLLAVALTLRGADVHILLCNEFLPACTMCSLSRFTSARELARLGPKQKVCWDCYAVGSHVYQQLSLRIHRYSEYASPEDIAAAEAVAQTVPLAEIASYTKDGLAVGEHALAGALRFFARGTLEEEPGGEAVLRRYLQASLLSTTVASRLLDAHHFNSICFNHGIYVPQGLIGEVARQHGVRVVNWNPAYRKKRFIFSHGDTYHHTLLAEPTADWENMPWTEAMEAQIMAYLKSRWRGQEDWIHFLHRQPIEDVDAIGQELGIDFSKPCVGMLTNVMWDAQLHYRANAFPNQLEWALQTIRYFANRPELQLIIRVHPAEKTGALPSRQPIIAEIRRHIPDLPPNVFLIPPESRISTYAVTGRCNSVIIYGTKTGVELAAMGIPVIVAGEAWIRNKGVTFDASSQGGYLKLLDLLPLASRLPEAMIRRARVYAYHFFFRRMIPIRCMEPARYFAPYRVQLSSIDDLIVGKDRGLDVICDGILLGTPFIYPAETISDD